MSSGTHKTMSLPKHLKFIWVNLAVVCSIVAISLGVDDDDCLFFPSDDDEQTTSFSCCCRSSTFLMIWVARTTALDVITSNNSNADDADADGDADVDVAAGGGGGDDDDDSNGGGDDDDGNGVDGLMLASLTSVFKALAMSCALE